MEITASPSWANYKFTLLLEQGQLNLAQSIHWMAMPRSSRDSFFEEEEDIIAQLLVDFGLFIGLYKTQMWMKGRK